MYRWVHPSQRGFTSTRQLAQNVVIMDTVLRGLGVAADPVLHPVFLVLAIINVANTSVHRLCLCKCLVRVCVCVWAGTSGVRVKWVVGR